MWVRPPAPARACCTSGSTEPPPLASEYSDTQALEDWFRDVADDRHDDPPEGREVAHLGPLGGIAEAGAGAVPRGGDQEQARHAPGHGGVDEARLDRRHRHSGAE